MVDDRGWTVFIPTRDSAPYVSIFLAYYRAMGIEPLYIVDGRSVDGTHDVLLANNATVHVIQPAGPFGVTELVQAACRLSQSAWVLRLDDDEFPSRQMVRFLDGHVRAGDTDKNENIYFNREWLKISEGKVVFFRSICRLRGSFYDGQVRLFFNDNLTFEHHIHTSGVITSGRKARLAPPECFIVHFDALLKGTDQKLAKMRKYETMEPGSAWIFSDMYLPEIYSDVETYMLHRNGMDQFLPLIADLPKLGECKPADLTAEEFRLIAETCPAGLKVTRTTNPGVRQA